MPPETANGSTIELKMMRRLAVILRDVEHRLVRRRRDGDDEVRVGVLEALRDAVDRADVGLAVLVIDLEVGALLEAVVGQRFEGALARGIQGRVRDELDDPDRPVLAGRRLRHHRATRRRPGAGGGGSRRTWRQAAGLAIGLAAGCRAGGRRPGCGGGGCGWRGGRAAAGEAPDCRLASGPRWAWRRSAARSGRRPWPGRRRPATGRTRPAAASDEKSVSSVLSDRVILH